MGTKWRAYVQGGAAALLLLSLVVTPSGGVQAQTGTFDSILTIEIESADLNAVAVGDVTGDGRNDIVATSFGPAYELLVVPQSENGDYLEAISYPLDNWPRSLVLGDLDGDGVDELVVGTDGGVEVYRQYLGQLDLIGGYTNLAYWFVRLGDLDSDGDLDIVGGAGWAIDLLVNDGTGMFPDRVNLFVGDDYGYRDIAVADVNSDGSDDLVGLPYERGEVLVWAQTIYGLAQPTTIGFDGVDNLMGLAVGDLTGDGANDAVVTYGRDSPTGRLGVLAQNPTFGVLGSPTAYPSYDYPTKVEVADFNNDGRLDVAVAHNAWEAVGVYLQQPDGGLGVEDLYDDVPYGNYDLDAMASGDLAGNAQPDVVLADDTTLAILYSTALVGGPGCAPAETQFGRNAEPSSVETQSGLTTQRRQLTRVEG